MVADSTTVLLVEDNPGYAALIRRWLTQLGTRGFAVDGVQMVEEARLRLAAGGVDVVLLDLTLPDSQGLETVTRMRAAAPDVPIVVLTGLDEDEYGPRALQAGAEDYLFKDRIDRIGLVRSLRYAQERHRLRSELRAANDRLKRLASADPLTGLLNRRGLEDAVATEVARARRTGGPLSAVLLDLDDFKRVNDTLGHAAGDVVLREVAARLRDSLRPTDVLARVGGDEFLALLPDTRRAEATAVAERLRLAASDATSRVGGKAPVGASLGIAAVPLGAPSIEDLLVVTQQALRQSKQEGKNRVSGGGDGPPGETVATVAELLRRPESFRAISLPIVALPQERCIGHELLARGPEGPFEMPRDFLRVAAERDLLTVVDLNCLGACAAAARELAVLGGVHLNLCPSTLLEVPTARLVDLAHSIGARAQVCFEISEQQFVGEPRELRDPVRALREQGILVALDDVGFGRSSLEALVLLEPDYVKVDPCFVRDIAGDSGRSRALARLVRIAEALGCAVIAEGVESRADLERVREAGIGLAQGFLWTQAGPRYDERACPSSPS